ncbi:hypothetical protein NW761_004102 [Fusarium oxysporum]|nr:hypothetical protein NW763_003243 [Fusarium oxysporum]KAK2673624.1 hypothetical protein RAB80_011167 [Fusarium oxysporum f. sp. vasinfectum]KAJ4067357.1 hypothetical protein NW753_002425 [Fusarium oxysporum]KAJ4080889.1 hypothetical protein NW756_010821 [Fusarium oxysporum]KAJ4097968.1 hypothetical protein NW761_004102 [Fusarium oxysporum]
MHKAVTDPDPVLPSTMCDHGPRGAVPSCRRKLTHETLDDVLSHPRSPTVQD